MHGDCFAFVVAGYRLEAIKHLVTKFKAKVAATGPGHPCPLRVWSQSIRAVQEGVEYRSGHGRAGRFTDGLAMKSKIVAVALALREQGGGATPRDGGEVQIHWDRPTCSFFAREAFGWSAKPCHRA